MKDIYEINIDSPIFKTMLHALDTEIKRVVESVYENEFESGDITLKLSLSFPEDSKEFPKGDELGFGDSEKYYFRKPYFKHTVSTSLKKQYKDEGAYTEDREVKLIDDEYLLVPVTEPQMNLLDDGFLK